MKMVCFNLFFFLRQQLFSLPMNQKKIRFISFVQKNSCKNFPLEISKKFSEKLNFEEDYQNSIFEKNNEK